MNREGIENLFYQNSEEVYQTIKSKHEDYRVTKKASNYVEEGMWVNYLISMEYDGPDLELRDLYRKINILLEIDNIKLSRCLVIKYDSVEVKKKNRGRVNNDIFTEDVLRILNSVI